MSIISREFRVTDAGAIDEIFRKQPELGVPSLDNAIINTTLVDSETGKIVGYGVVKMFAEAVLILDQSIPKKSKAEAVKEAMETALIFCKAKGLEILYAVAKDEKFGIVLENRYKFDRVPGSLFCRCINQDGD